MALIPQFKEKVAVLLVQMIMDFIEEKKAEGKDPTLELMIQELEDRYIKK